VVVVGMLRLRLMVRVGGSSSGGGGRMQLARSIGVMRGIGAVVVAGELRRVLLLEQLSLLLRMRPLGAKDRRQDGDGA